MNAFIPVYLTKVLFDTPLFRTEEQDLGWAVSHLTTVIVSLPNSKFESFTGYRKLYPLCSMYGIFTNIYHHLPSFTP
jgi:hypothetical protein